MSDGQFGTNARTNDAHIRRFLALAEPVLWANPELDEAGWEQLRAVARQSPLTDEELQAILRDLYHRGVLRRIPEFLLPVEPTRPAEVEATRLSGSGDGNPAGDVTTGSTAARWVDIKQQVGMAEFIERARAVLAACGRPDSRTYALLANLAHSLGLSENQFDAALHALAGNVSQAQPGAEAANARVASPAAGSSVQPPAWDARRRPAEAYRQYLQIALADKKQNRGYVSASAARKLIAQGVEKLGLAPVYAQQLLHEAAQAMHLPVLLPSAESEQEGADEKVEAFLERAAPIVAQERGLTARAQLLLAALAKELGLEEEKWRAALEDLPKDRPSAQQLYQQRTAAFESHLRRTLQPLAGYALPPPQQQPLLWQGENLYGLDADTVRHLLDEVARSLGLLLMDDQRARQALTAHVYQTMGTSSRLSADHEWQIITLGQQWGIPAGEVRSILGQCAAENRRRARRERRMLTGILVAGGLVTVLLLGLFYRHVLTSWVGKSWPLGPVTVGDSTVGRRSQPIENDPAEEQTGDVPLSNDGQTAEGESKPNTWWTAKAELLLAQCRRLVRDEQGIGLEWLKSPEPATRMGAYQALVPTAVREPQAPHAIQPLGQLLAFCAAADPDAQAKEQLWALLEQAAESDEQNIQEDPPQWLFRAAVRILIAAVDLSPSQTARVECLTRLNRLYETSLPQDAPLALREETIFGRAVTRWAERLAFRAAGWPTDRARAAWQSLQPDMANYLSDAEQRRLLLAFLSQAVPVAGTQWRIYQPDLEEIIARADRADLARLFDVARRATDDGLKRYLLEEIARVLGEVVVPGTSLDQLTIAVRTKLGLPESAEESWQDRHRRWISDARSVLASKVPSSKLPRLCEQIAELSRLQLQGLAIWKQHLPTWQYAATVRDRAMEDAPSEPSVLKTASTLESIPVVTEAVRGIESMRRLRRYADRLIALQVLAQLAESVPDIPPQSADVLATCLVELNGRREPQDLLQLAPRFAHWNNLRLALAAEVGKLSTHTPDMAELLEAMYGRTFTSTSADSWPAEVRLQLLDESIAVLAGRVAKSMKDSEHPLARLQQTLAVHWQHRQNLFAEESPATEAGAEDRPGTDVLLAAIRAAHNQISRRPGLSPQGTQWLRRVEEQLPIVDAIARHDLERAVRLEQLWLHVLGAEVDFARRDASGSQFVNRALDQTGSQLLEQLFYLESAALELLTMLIGEVK